ncbi:M48 family metallopeptidase [Algibacillus agarilyticus]|uniref:M48 family metallopeptidase n=1 Tax=Algibacillus agarilyticus TaxID=2234133 RepID=UPI000DD0D063|nr:M48 family metallopeptidase [Algibacillus agarilyticus]
MSASLKYLNAYPASLQAQIQHLIDDNKLADFLRKKYPEPHTYTKDSDLHRYVLAIKNQYLKKSSNLSKIIYDKKIHVVNNALGLHTYVSRVQGSKLKSKNELRVSSVFQESPEPFLNMIVVHELAHLKEKEHNKAFYRLCEYMLPNYHQLEFDMRVYLTQLELGGRIY